MYLILTESMTFITFISMMITTVMFTIKVNNCIFAELKYYKEFEILKKIFT